MAHPMEEKHYIEWIELLADGRSYTKFLKPGDAPEAFFEIDAAKVTAREYCNLQCAVGLNQHFKIKLL